VKKPARLRAALVARIPEFARDPDALVMFIDKGRCRAPMTAQRGFMWSYDLNLVAANYTGDPAVLFFLVVEWLRVEQPDLLTPSAPGLAFEVDILDPETSDVLIVLTLDEVVTAAPQEDGSVRVEAVVEPDPLFPGEEPLAPDLAALFTEADGQVAP